MKIGTVEIELWLKENSYNDAANNERMLEVPLAEWFRQKYPDLVEVGAVTPYYFNTSHIVFDPLDEKGSSKTGAECLDYTNKTLLSISTIEHIGRGDYKQPVIDGLALEVLKKMMRAKTYLITFACSYKQDLDLFAEDAIKYVIKLKRVDLHRWELINSLKDVHYGEPFPGGNGLYVITNCEELFERKMNIESLRQQHESVYNEVIEMNQYRVSKEDLEGKNVLDIGANNGIFTVLAKSYNSKKIVAVESNIGAFNLLQDNTKDCDNVIILNKAASANSGERVIVGRQPEFCAHDGRCYVIADPKGDVETISLKDLLSNFDDEPVVLKMDCEGSEYSIIYGADVKDLKRCSSILIEIHENIASVLGKTGLIEKLRSYLKQTGFIERWVFDYVDTRVKICRFDLEVPEVTVVISEFLRPELLVEQIESFQNQTLKPTTIIVWQTQVEGHREAYVFENKYPNVHVVETGHDFNLPGRFAIPLLAKTDYVCLTDDDVFPAPGWLQECYNILKKDNAVVCPYGVRYSSDNCNDLFSKRYGDDGDRCDGPTLVDMGGHAWFGKKEWFSLFWREPVIDEKIADDIHFAYMLKKYGIRIFVSPYPELNKNVYGNTKPDAGKGVKALHARKWEDEKVWKDLTRVGWDSKELDYLKNNLDDFSKKREEVVKKYMNLERVKKEIHQIKETFAAKKVKNIDVTCIVSTKDRYFSTLPSTLMAIAQQTYKPKTIIVLDDGDFKPVGQTESIYQTIFQYFLLQGIYWIHEPGQRMGQVHNHIKSLEMSKTEWIWRVDDDEVPEKDVLEKLVSNVDEDVGAIAGLVIPATDIKPLPSVIHNKIEDIYLGYNEQWFAHPDNAKPKEVDHLYSSFLYRKSIASYNTDLSPVCHREETMLTYEMKLKGFKNIIDPSARTWHFRNPAGGIRSHADVSYYSHDERVFTNKISEWGVKVNDYSFVVLNNGIGDHYMFKFILPEYLKKNRNKKNIFFVCYPELFNDVPNTTLASIADAKILFGDDLKAYDVYTYMADNRWSKQATEAFKRLYHIDENIRQITAVRGTGKTLVISPYSKNPGTGHGIMNHAKSYPFWKELIKLLKTLDYKIIQIGSGQEVAIEGVDETRFGRSLKEIESLIKDCGFWISIDNFLPHLCNTMEKVIKGVVIFATSDPDIFGYPYNKNILKSRKFLRSFQFKDWIGEVQHPEYFNKPEEIFIGVKQFLNDAAVK